MQQDGVEERRRCSRVTISLIEDAQRMLRQIRARNRQENGVHINADVFLRRKKRSDAAYAATNLQRWKMIADSASQDVPNIEAFWNVRSHLNYPAEEPAAADVSRSIIRRA